MAHAFGEQLGLIEVLCHRVGTVMEAGHNDDRKLQALRRVQATSPSHVLPQVEIAAP